LGGPQKNADYPANIGQIPELPLNCPLYKKYPSVHTDLKVPAFYSKDLGVKKENPEFFKKVLKANSKIKPSEIIFIEDRPQNIYAAKSMGIDCIQFVMNGIKREKVEGVPVARTTKEIVSILHRKGIR
jgi:methionine salvage enolase-phosphatase E1